MIMSDKCKEKIFGDYRYRPCSRKAVTDGFCKQHHPDTIAARNKKSQERWEKERYNSTGNQLARAKTRITELEAQLSKSQWVSVEDRLPEEGQVCFVYCEAHHRLECVPFIGVWPLVIINWESGENTCPVTHWMPLPSAPL